MTLDKDLFIKALKNIDVDDKNAFAKVTDKSIELFESIELPNTIGCCGKRFSKEDREDS